MQAIATEVRHALPPPLANMVAQYAYIDIRTVLGICLWGGIDNKYIIRDHLQYVRGDREDSVRDQNILSSTHEKSAWPTTTQECQGLEFVVTSMITYSRFQGFISRKETLELACESCAMKVIHDARLPWRELNAE